MRLEGTIAGAGFASGDRFVVGLWDEGPLGRMTDVMWARSNGTRVLLAGSAEVAAFVGGVYEFDEIHVVPPELVCVHPTRIELVAGTLRLELVAGRPRRIFGLRPKWLRRWTGWVRFEDLVLRGLVGRWVLEGAEGVKAYGVSRSGVREWYCIDGYRPVVWARAELEGVDLGPLRPLEPPVNFGFSEFPRVPALVRCAPVLEGAGRWLPAASARAGGEPA